MAIGPLARRLIVPIILLVGFVSTWLVSSRLGDTTAPVALGSTEPSLETPLASVRRLPAVALDSLEEKRVGQVAASFGDPPTPLSCLVVMVGNEVVYNLRGQEPLLPGFAQLLATTYAALELLGPGFVFETRVMAADPADDDGVIEDNLYLIGGGDPVLMSRNHAQSFRPTLPVRTPVEALAMAVVDAGVTEVDGSVVGVDRRYDGVDYVDGWPETAISAGLVGPLSALQLDDGLEKRAASNGGVAVAAEDAAAHAAERFDDLLEASDVRVRDKSRSDRDGDELQDLVPVASISSPPLSEIVRQILAANDVSAAELVLKEMGRQYRDEGSTDAGAEAVRQQLLKLGVELELAPADASGLDSFSTTSCLAVAQTVSMLTADAPLVAVLPSHRLPGVYGGALADVETVADLGVVGGGAGDGVGLVIREMPDGSESPIVIASLVNQPSGTDDAVIAYHRSIIAAVDGLRDGLTRPNLAD